MFIPVQTIVLDTATLGAALPVAPASINAILLNNKLLPPGIEPQYQIQAIGTDFIMRTGADAAAATPATTITAQVRPLRTFVARDGAILTYGLRADDNFISALSKDGVTAGTVEVTIGYGAKV